MPAPIVHAASAPEAAIAPRPEPKWYGEPVTGVVHGFFGIRTACGSHWWTAAWRIVGAIADVDRAKACPDCITATGSTEAELHAGDGNR